MKAKIDIDKLYAESGAEKFKGKNWDQKGNLIDCAKDSPGMVYDLPILPLMITEKVPKHISVRFLDGNWYGRGPEIVLWDEKRELHINFPLWARAKMPHFVKMMRMGRTHPPQRSL